MLNNLDYIGILALATVPIVFAFIWFCYRHNKKVDGMDVAFFTFALAGAGGSVWMFIEATLNLNNPPQTWRVYVLVMSFGFVFHLLRKCWEMWPRSDLPTPDEESVGSSERPGGK